MKDRVLKLLGLKTIPNMKDNSATVPQRPQRPPTAIKAMPMSPDQQWLGHKKKEMDAVFGDDYAITNPFAFAGYLQASATLNLAQEVKQLRQLLASGEAAITVLSEHQPDAVEA